MKKLAVIFPGVGYTCTKPLLYYTASMAAERGYEIIRLDYGHHPAVPGKRGGDGPVIILKSVEIDLGPGAFEKIRHGNGPFHRVSIILWNRGGIKAWTGCSIKKRRTMRPPLPV